MGSITGMSVAGVILAGGASRRFGRDKATALLDGRRLIDHVVQRLAPQVSAVAIAGPSHAYGLSCPVLRDGEHAGKGPLAGLEAGMRWAAEGEAEWILTAPCDTPFLPRNLTDLLLDPDDMRPAALQKNGYAESACALWPVAALPEITRRLAAGDNLSLIAALRALDFRSVCVGAARLDGDFTNINTLDDLAKLS